MTKSTAYFTTPMSYKSKGVGDDKSNGNLGKKDHFSQSSNISDSHGGEKSGFLGGSQSNGGHSNGGEKSGFLGGSQPNGGHSNGGEKSGFLGGSQPNGSYSNGDEKSGFLGGSQPNGGQPVGNQVINGTGCNDTLRGNNYGSDTLVGTTDVARGVGEHDILIGGNARDTFVLGDARGSFYLGQGNVDYAEIHNFGRCNDLIQLAGSAQDYSISYTNGISSVYHKDAGGCMDLVAQVDSACSPLDLNANYFQYVPQCGGSPVLMF
jgi:hypothetical protein